MSAIPYCDLTKAGIHKPTDLIKFPWDDDRSNLPTQDEVEQWREEAAAINAQRQNE